jgi:xanthosine utilization system XapX-like protein
MNEWFIGLGAAMAVAVVWVLIKVSSYDDWD